MGLELEYADGATPIDEDEKQGLMIKTIDTLGELKTKQLYLNLHFFLS